MTAAADAGLLELMQLQCHFWPRYRPSGRGTDPVEGYKLLPLVIKANPSTHGFKGQAVWRSKQLHSDGCPALQPKAPNRGCRLDIHSEVQ
jgi:hypothetical protein